MFIISFMAGFLVLCMHSRARRSAKTAKRIKEAYTFDKENVSGDAHYSTDADCKKGGLLTGFGIWLGFSSHSGKTLLYSGDSHLLTIGPTGTGKARDLQVASILTLGRKVLIANDPKGQLLAITYKERLKVGPVYNLAPFASHGDLKGVRYVRYNPLAPFNAKTPYLAIRCDKIADGLVLNEGEGKNRFFSDGAKELMSGIMMAVICDPAETEKNLVRVSEILCGDVARYCKMVVANTGNRYIRDRLSSFATGDELSKPCLDIIQTARVNTQFIRNEALGPSLCGSDFTFKELRQEPCSLYWVMPLDASSDICDRYYRLILACGLAEMLSADCLGTTPTLLILDEAAGLGRLSALEQAITMARGFGIQIWTVFTDIPVMQKIYKESFRSFIANAGIRIFLTPSDTVTADEVSKLSGITEVLVQSRSISLDAVSGEPRVSDGANQHARPLLLPHEVRELPGDEMLIFASGVKGVIRAKRKPYWITHPHKFCPDPFEKNKRNRR